VLKNLGIDKGIEPWINVVATGYGSKIGP